MLLLFSFFTPVPLTMWFCLHSPPPCCWPLQHIILPSLLGEGKNQDDDEDEPMHDATASGGEEEEAALAAAAVAAHDKGDLPYTKLAKTKGFQPGPHEDYDLETLDPAKLLDTPLDAPGMAACEAVRQQVNGFMQGPKVQGLTEPMQKELRVFAADRVRRAYLDEVQGQAQRLRDACGEAVGTIKKWKPGSPIDLSHSPKKVEAATKQLSEPSLNHKAIGDGICLTLDQVVDQALAKMGEAAKEANPDNPDPTSFESVGLDVLRGELLTHHKAKKADQTMAGFGMQLSQSLDKLAAAYELAQRKRQYRLACDLMKCSNHALSEINKFMKVADTLGFKESKRLYLSIGNPFSNITKAQWDNIVAATTNAAYRQALAGLGDATPSPAVKFESRKRHRKTARPFKASSSESEDSSSDEEGRKRKRRKGGYNSPPSRRPPFCTYCKKKGHTKDECRKRKAAKRDKK